MKYYIECKIIESTRFCILKENKWKKAENNNLIKIIQIEGIILYNICYINLIENLLKREFKRAKTITEKVIGKEVINKNAKKINVKIKLIKIIKVMAKIFYEKEYLKKEDFIYKFDEIQRLFQKIKLSLKDFFD